jgi:hypothetical protein
MRKMPSRSSLLSLATVAEIPPDGLKGLCAKLALLRMTCRYATVPIFLIFLHQSNFLVFF